MIIKNGFVIDPKIGLSGIYDIRIQDKRIMEIGNCATLENEEIIDATGFIVAPGLIDVHVHFREPGFTYKEDIHTGAKAAAKGGFTSVICMANTKPPVDSIETLSYVLDQVKKEAIHVLTTAAVTKGLGGKELVDFETLAQNGACGFTDDGIPLMDENLAIQAMEKAAELNLPISFHEENPSLIQNNGINHGRVSEQLGVFGSPAAAEDTLVARDCMLALHTGACINIQHISSKNAVALVRTAKQLGANVMAEATPHHFTLTEDALLVHGTLAKMNPPLRAEEDRQAIIAGLKDGTIDIIATDHAPHSEEEKARPLTAAPSGIIGLETALSLGITALVRSGCLTMAELLEKMTVNPAKLYRLDCGSIEVGGHADLVIFSEKERWTVDSFLSKSSNSPFKGTELYGKIKYTICDGNIVYSDAE